MLDGQETRAGDKQRELAQGGAPNMANLIASINADNKRCAAESQMLSMNSWLDSNVWFPTPISLYKEIVSILRQALSLWFLSTLITKCPTTLHSSNQTNHLAPPFFKSKPCYHVAWVSIHQ
jgi:hypothetical protein